ncbi:hypothetical protein AJ79_06109 [Helicocarpus griseus UAMH5409]|uniref:Uncharacterized protein n=1 Tax=Helicocarpus griseus UAMH5409 TaxID=1447875 RepID=A0A2B7XGS7_9EURO|nr:hypothetical protein AJ79_06109 [Helicocarpus griseus UAMH5409]
MKSILAYASFALALLSPLASAAPVENGGPQIAPFTLRAITPRGSPTVINNKLQLLGNRIVLGPVQGGTEFVAYIEPSPKGKLIKQGSNQEIFFLDPVNNPPVPGYHTFKSTHSLSSLSSTSQYQGFFATGAGCGSHCGGPQLVYDQTPDDDQYKGNWYVSPRPNNERGYSLHWVSDGEAPEGHILVYLLRESVPQ